MYTYQGRLMNPRCLYQTTLKVEPIDMYTYKLCVVISVVCTKKLKVRRLSMYTNQVRIVYARQLFKLSRLTVHTEKLA
jgi:hypothetical protein